MKRAWLMVPLLLALPFSPAAAQQKEDDAQKKEERARQRSGAQEQSADRQAEKDRLLSAIRLPRTANDAREAGVREEDVQGVLRKARQKDVRAHDIRVILEDESRSAREQGPTGNFGAVVQEKLDQGLRGRDLAEAIHAEKAARGKSGGKGKGPEAGKGGKQGEQGPQGQQGRKGQQGKKGKGGGHE